MSFGFFLIISFAVVGTYVLWGSPALARSLGRKAARSSRFLIVKLFVLVLYILGILVIGGKFFMFYIATIYALVIYALALPDLIDPLFMAIPLVLMLALLEVNAIGAFWAELRHARLVDQLLER